MKEMPLKIDISSVFPFVSRDTIYSYEPAAMEQQHALHQGTGAGKDFLGWMELPSSIPGQLVAEIESAAFSMRESLDAVVVIGIGGSYLGAKAILSALSHNFDAWLGNQGPDVFFAGHNIGEDYMAELLDVLEHKDFGLIVISKSGTTTEPAIAFRILKEMLIMNVGEEEACRRIVAITDDKRGALRKLADQSGYRTFVIPDDTGGRYSVLTPVGLLPIAVAGFDIRSFIGGAKAMQEATAPSVPFADNPAVLYAATRNALYNEGKIIEILANYDPKLLYLSEWWKQLYGESEGKQLKGIFPASVNFTADLHSMGQYIQEGERKLFETVISVEKTSREVTIPADAENLDQLNYLAGRRVDAVNKMAELGTALAHVDGGVPNIRIGIPSISEFDLGELIYFFEKACGISGYMLGVNPFDQPGVEAYKKNMFALLEKPGFEEETRAIQERLKE